MRGGTRVPFVVRWPKQVKPGITDALVCQVDFLASFAALTHQPLAQADAPDSCNVLPALLGESKTGRERLVEQAGPLALREGTLKYIEPSKGDKRSKFTNVEMGHDALPQVYDLAGDLAEQSNLQAQDKAKAADLAKRLQELREAGRSRP